MFRKLLRIEFTRIDASEVLLRLAGKGFPAELVEETEAGWTIQVETPGETRDVIEAAMDDLLRVQNLGGGGTFSGEPVCLKK